MKVLVVINGYYPYSRGEDYLSNEMRYVKGFDRVLICPMFVFGDKKSEYSNYRDNENIEYFNSSKTYKSRILFCIYFLLRHMFFYKEFIYILRTKKIKFNCLKSFLRTSFKSVNAYYDVKKELYEKYAKEEITLYSYWMADSSVVVSLLKLYSGLNIRYTFSRCHRFDVYEYANRNNYIPYREYILSTLDKIYSISDDAKSYLELLYEKYAKNKIVVSRLGTEDYGVSNVSKNDVLRVVSCSWLRPVKRVDMIFDALNSLDFPIEWTHYGDGELMPTLKSKVNELENKKLRINLLGKVPNVAVLQKYKEECYDIFINVSENEGVPVSIMEAMSFGMIIIATNVGGTAELVYNEKNGYLLPKDCDIQQIADRLKCVYYMSSEEYSLTREMSRKIWEKYSSSKINYNRFYNEIAK